MTRASEIIDGGDVALTFAETTADLTLKTGALPGKLRKIMEDYGTASNLATKVSAKMWDFGAFNVSVYGGLADIYADYAANELVTISGKNRTGAVVSIAFYGCVSDVKPGGLVAGDRFSAELTITPTLQTDDGVETAPVITVGT